MSHTEDSCGDLCRSCAKHDWEYHLDTFKNDELYSALEIMFEFETVGRDDYIEDDEYNEAKETVRSELEKSFPSRKYAVWMNNGFRSTTPGFPGSFFRISEGSNEPAFFVGDGLTMIILPSLAELMEKFESCSFCGVLAELIQNQWKERNLETKDLLQRSLVCVFGTLQSSEPKAEPYTITIYPERLDNDWTAITVVHLRPLSATGLLPRQIIDLNAVAAGLFRKWYRQCSEHHARCQTINSPGWTEAQSPREPSAMETARSYTSVDAQIAPGLKLVDVYNNNVINAPETTKYVALSYVWGKEAVYVATMDAFVCRKGQDPYARSSYLPLDCVTLPRTIIDAMQVVKDVGERYLWVDSLCINQNDPKDLERMLAKMFLIYRNAAFTIIAASGQDANAGLPRVRPCAVQRTELVARVGNVCFVTPMKEPMTLKPWAERAWTYQEGFFSGKALLFLEDRVYWFCQDGSYCEEHSSFKHPSGLYNKWRFGFGFDSSQAIAPCDFDQVDTRKMEHMLSVYVDSVQRYSSRQLTKQNDILNAFSAILGYMYFMYSVRSCWGLPLFDFHKALAWFPVEFTRGRRSGFPTWSWSSYIGAVRYSGMSQRSGLPREGSPTWPWDVSDNATCEDPFETGILRITTPLVSMSPPRTMIGVPMLDDGTEWKSGERDAIILGEYIVHQRDKNSYDYGYRAKCVCAVLLVRLGVDGIYSRDGLCFVSEKDARSATGTAKLREIRLG